MLILRNGTVGSAECPYIRLICLETSWFPTGGLFTEVTPAQTMLTIHLTAIDSSCCILNALMIQTSYNQHRIVLKKEVALLFQSYDEALK